MSSGGLQRRRVGGNSATSTPTNDSYSNLHNDDNSSRTETYYDSNGRRVAYDPHDLQQNNTETFKAPRLTLMEEVLLLGLKDSEGYLSFWNDNISYALRGCIIMELAFRGKIGMVADPGRRRLPLCDRYLQVIDDKNTGEALLDETVKIMKASEPLSVGTWIDYLSGETWNLTKISYQLKQVRERLAKGLVDKGILRTEKRNFFLFDMATHPVADATPKDELRRRVITMLTARTVGLSPTPWFGEEISFRYLRSVALISGAYAATVLENVLTNLSYDARDQAFSRADELVSAYSEWPFGTANSTGVGTNLSTEISQEIGDDKELQVEIIAAVLSVYSKLDSIL